MKKLLENTPNLDLEQAMVRELIVEDNKVIVIKTMLGTSYKAKTVVFTTRLIWENYNDDVEIFFRS